MITNRPLQRCEFLACAGFAGVLLIFLFFYATVPITDPDFGWHLKSGEVMVQNGGLLQTDPFSFTDDGVVSNREALTLKGYWLWQITVYGLYSLFEINGIFLVNFFTALAMVGVVVWQMRRHQLNHALAIVLVTLGFTLFRSIYYLERPQVVSFLFAAILFGLIMQVREGGRLGWTLPLLMMTWANLHGGFVVGDLILLCFAAGAVIEYRQDLPRLRHLLTWVVIAIGASLLNPNGVLVFVELFSFYNSELMSRVNEFQSSWTLFSSGRSSLLLLWLLIALYGVGIWRSRRIFWPEFIVVLFLAYFSVAHVRNVGFFAVAMLPGVGYHLQHALFLPPFEGEDRGGEKSQKVFQCLVIVLSMMVLLWQVNEDRKRGSLTASVSTKFPIESTQFIMTSGLQGRMFNNYNYGGYQLWQLYPKHLVFIDSRCMDIDVFDDWLLMVSASLKEVGSRKEFEVLLDRYEIDYVVQPHIYQDTGRLTPLVKFLLVEPEWIPVYIDQNSYILVRNSQKNASVIERYRMEKSDFNNKMVGYLKALCNAWPAEIVNHVALAEMLIFVGRYDEAELRLELISQIQPNNRDLPALRNQLSVLKNMIRP